VQLALELDVLVLELLLVLVNLSNLLETPHDLLQAHLDGASGVAAVVDAHVHEQLGLVQLLLQARQVLVGVLGHDAHAQLVQLVGDHEDVLALVQAAETGGLCLQVIHFMHRL
jgi:hypothetical protein